MTGRHRVLRSSFAVSLGVHLALLAAVAVLWAPPIQQTLGILIPVQLLPVAGDQPAGSPAPARAEGPRPLPPLPAPARAEVQRPRLSREARAASEVADRLADLATGPAPAVLAPGEADASGPKVVGEAPAFASSAAASEPGAAGAGLHGIASAVQALGRGDALAPAGDGGSTAPGYRVNPRPEYPPQARENGYQGTAVLRVRVLPDGKAGEVILDRSSGHEILDGAAMRTVKAWLFVPATRNGIAVPSWVTVPVRFSLAS